VRKNQLRYCVFTAEKNWLYWLEYPKDQREMCHEDLLEMSRFVRENAPVFGVKDWEFPLRACAFLMRHPNTVSLLLARMVNALPSGRRKVLY